MRSSGTDMAAKKLESNSEYASYDTDGDGQISYQEFNKVFESLGCFFSNPTTQIMRAVVRAEGLANDPGLVHG